MKFKKLLISASAIAAGSGLLATVLTSCAKASVDDKLKIKLDDGGLLYNPGNMGETYNISYQNAIKWALTRSNNWVQFKNALAEEVVFNWFTNRMATSKTADDKNTSFRTSYDEWEYQINKDYNTTIQNCKNKYGANWEFYLQNEYLAPYGGTEESYKHAKLVEKVKADFISKVFAKNYFGYNTETETVPIYPHIYAKATKDVNKRTLWNPENWKNMGFFARAELSFNPGETPKAYKYVDPNYLAKHPDGDYAAIQDYVFNRWFETEKPFFADAALFKYSNPKNVAHGKLEEIYNGTRSGVKIPTDKPSEAFPFFGADAGTAKAVKFFNDAEEANFVTTYKDAQGVEHQNGTITIKTEDTDDSQTCLLVCGNQMFTSLFTPYAMACGNLYGRMMGLTTETSANSLTLEQVRKNILGDGAPSLTDDFAILKNFFYQFDTDAATSVPSTIKKYLDLNTIYGGLTGTGSAGDPHVYHCPLFNPCNDYTYFYGDAATNKSGIRYIANTIEVPIQSEFEEATHKMPAQPWVMELNEAGVHILTIDGFNLVNAETTAAAKKAKLKQLVMYRLMQKQINDNTSCISTDLLGESGKLKTYFSDNFTNIVLELAAKSKDDSDYTKYNVFRTIESYALETSEQKEDHLFLYNIWKDHSLGTAYANLTSYLAALDKYEEIKKCVSTLDTANNKIYSYRSKQISNAKAREDFAKTIFENGLLTPFAYTPRANEVSNMSINNCMYDYNTLNRVIIQNVQSDVESGSDFVGWTKLYNLLNNQTSGIVNHPYIADVIEKATVNGTTGFSPQISDAKNKTSNRFWYKSSLVDKFMYAFMGNKANTANAIKKQAYKYYIAKNDVDGKWFGDHGQLADNTTALQAFASTYARSKLFTGDKNLASYAQRRDIVGTSYYTRLNSSYEDFITRAKIENGENADDVLNYVLWQATVMYLIGSDKTSEPQEFDNFYTILNSKIGDDESALVGYMARGYGYGDSELSKTPIEKIDASKSYDYSFSPDVDNIFDKNGYAGRDADTSVDPSKNSRQTSTSYWNVVDRKYSGNIEKIFAGFLGLQTKTSNQIDSTSGLQTAVFSNFAKATDGAHDIEKGSSAEYNDNQGCWFQFAGSKDTNGKLLPIASLTVGSETFDADEWFKEGTEYANVRKVAKKIREWGTMDDLRTLAKTLADAYDGHSPFADIASGSTTYENVDEMRMAMLKLLPSTKEFTGSHKIKCFQRVKNVEVHTLDTVPSYVFKDSTGKNAYKLLMTQINKADAIEKTLTPEYKDGEWVATASSPITAEEFWNILFTMASESTVQQRAITEIVKTAFGDEKLIVYDAQIYNQFDSVWIKDWTKKTLGA